MKSSTTFQLPNATKIAALKKEYGEIRLIQLPTPHGLLQCIVRYPKLEDVSMAAFMCNGNSDKAGTIQLDACWIDGDKLLKHRAEYYVAAGKEMGLIFKTYERRIEDVKITPSIKAKLLDQPSISADQLKEIEAEGVVRQIEVLVGDRPKQDEKDTRISYKGLLRLPSMENLDAAESIGLTLIEKGQSFLNDCWLCGDEQLRSGDDETRYGACLAASQLFREFKAEVVKL
jgi:hypothetical protein